MKHYLIFSFACISLFYCINAVYDGYFKSYYKVFEPGLHSDENKIIYTECLKYYSSSINDYVTQDDIKNLCLDKINRGAARNKNFIQKQQMVHKKQRKIHEKKTIEALLEEEKIIKRSNEMPKQQ